MKVTLADGIEIELLPQNARVRHKNIPELTGRVAGHEYQKPGVLSAIPYRIDWDDEQLAHAQLGMFYFWGCGNTIEAENH